MFLPISQPHHRVGRRSRGRLRREMKPLQESGIFAVFGQNVHSIPYSTPNAVRSYLPRVRKEWSSYNAKVCLSISTRPRPPLRSFRPTERASRSATRKRHVPRDGSTETSYTTTRVAPTLASLLSHPTYNRPGTFSLYSFGPLRLAPPSPWHERLKSSRSPALYQHTTSPPPSLSPPRSLKRQTRTLPFVENRMSKRGAKRHIGKHKNLEERKYAAAVLLG